MNAMSLKRVRDLRNASRVVLEKLAIDIGLVGGHSDYTRFIILSRGRSGSNFLRGLLNSHSQILTFGELFRVQNSIGWEYPGYNLNLQPQNVLRLAQSDPIRFLEEKVFRKYPSHISAVGFKIFYYHARDSQQPLWSFLRDQKNLKIIHLKRNNTLRVLLSLKRAFQTNIWTNNEITEVERLKYSLDYEECLGEFIWSETVKKEFDTFFRDSDKIDIFYEDLASGYEIELKRILAFLHVSFENLKPTTYKQSSQPLSEEISNYFELKERFKDSPWHEFFED
jgi:LPS sulfotransferase NodH